MSEELSAGIIDPRVARRVEHPFGRVEETGRVSGGNLAKVIISEDRIHSHKTFDETYIFLRGYGTMRLQDQVINVHPGDVVNIPKGSVHGLYPTKDTRNLGVNSYTFLCIASPQFDPEDITYY